MKKFLNIFLILIYCFVSVSNSVCATDTRFDENGNLTYYYSQYQGSEIMTIPTIDKNQALEIVKSFMDKYAPEAVLHISTDVYTIKYNKSVPYGYIITFPRIINNIIYDADNISFFVDSKNGQVISYSKNFSSYTSVEGENNIISVNDAQNKYITAMGIQLQYNKKIVHNKIIPYLVYVADDILINANTGNIIPSGYYIPQDGYFDIVNTAEKVSEYIDNETIIPIHKADEIISKIEVLGVTSDYKLVSVDYLKNYDDTYLISLLYKTGINTKEVTLNAQNGLLVEYSDNSTHTEQYKTTSPEEFLNTYYKDYCNHVIKRKSINDNYSVFLYERLVNNIPYKSNGIYACFDDGKLTKLSFAWDNVEFPSANDVVSPKYIYQQFLKKTGLELTYHKRENGALVPVYKKASQGTGIFDALSAKQLDYDGSIFYSSKELNYLDINTHYSGYAAKQLSACDIYVSSGNVCLKDNISQQEYMLLLSEFIKGTKPIINTTGILTDDQREMLYAYMYEHNILTRAETDYTSYITRADAVKYFLRILGYGTVGDMSDIFINHFDDANEIPEDSIGYVELARALKIINGSYGNKFKPNEYITNGDCLIIIYNYLKTVE